MTGRVIEMFQFDARYYDPRSSRPHAVRVLVQSSELVSISGHAVDVRCKVSELAIGSPVLGDVLESLLLPSGAKCETLDRVAVSRLRQLSGQRGRFGSVHRLEQSWPAAIAATGLVFLILISAYMWAIPRAARAISEAFPSVGQKIGQGTLKVLDLRFQPSELPAAQQERIQGAFQAFSLGYPDLPLKLVFRQAGFPNAFALPDGTVVLTDELVALSTDEDQVLGVLLHEIGHVAHGHALRRVIESSALGVLLLVYYGDADQVATVASGLPVLYAESRYSREEETEADTLALERMRHHGLAPHHFADMLRALEREVGSAHSALRYFSSHPATHERAERFDLAQRSELTE